MSGFDTDFELDILAAASKDAAYRKVIKRILRRCEETPWTSWANERIWKIIERLGDNDVLTPGVVAKVIRKIEDDDKAEQLGDAARSVFRRAPKTSGYAATELRQWVLDRNLRAGLRDAITSLSNGDYNEVMASIRSLGRRTYDEIPWEGGDWWAEWESRQERRIAERDDPTLHPRIPTRFPTVDAALNGGIIPGQVGVILGHTNKGKSALAQRFAFNAAGLGHLSVYISTEMGKRLVDTRFDAMCFGVSITKFETCDFEDDDLDDFRERRRALHARLAKRLFTYAVPPQVLNIAMLHEIVDEVEDKTGEKVRSVVLDSPAHAQPMVNHRDYRLRQSQVYWDYKQFGEERDVACWATDQASDKDKESGKSLVRAHDVAESYDKARIADIVLTINQTDAEFDDDIYRLFIAKNRGGEKGAVAWIQTEMSRMHLEEVDPP